MDTAALNLSTSPLPKHTHTTTVFKTKNGKLIQSGHDPLVQDQVTGTTQESEIAVAISM